MKISSHLLIRRFKKIWSGCINTLLSVSESLQYCTMKSPWAQLPSKGERIRRTDDKEKKTKKLNSTFCYWSMISNLESENAFQLSKTCRTSVTPDVRATNKVVPGPDQLVKFSKESNVNSFPHFFFRTH